MHLNTFLRQVSSLSSASFVIGQMTHSSKNGPFFLWPRFKIWVNLISLFFLQDSHLVHEKSIILLHRYCIFFHCIWYLQRFGIDIVSFPFHLLCPNLTSYCFLQLFLRFSLPYRAIGGLVEIITASICGALTCIVIRILCLLLYSILTIILWGLVLFSSLCKLRFREVRCLAQGHTDSEWFSL